MGCFLFFLFLTTISPHAAKIGDLKSEIVCHGKENRKADEYHLRMPCFYPLQLNHLPVRKSRRQIPARYWPWDNYVNSLFGDRGRVWAWEKSPGLQGDNTHIAGEGQFLWDDQSRRYCCHPHSAQPTCGGIDHQGQRQRCNSGMHLPSRAFWNGKPRVTTDVLLGKEYTVATELPIQATVESRSQLLEGTSPKKTVGETGNGLPCKEVTEDPRVSYNSHFKGAVT